MFALGLVAAIALPKESLLDLSGRDSGTLSEAFTQTAAFTLAGIKTGDLVLRVTPAIFGLLMLGTCAVSVALLSPRTRTAGLSVRTRILWGAATGIPLAFMFLIIALSAGETETSAGALGGDTFQVEAGSTFLLALMWGVLGGGLGSLWAMRREGSIGDLAVPAWAREGGRTLVASLKPLGLLLALCVVIGTAVWTVQTFRDTGDIRSGTDRTTLGATVDNVLYAADHGVHFAELGAVTEFHNPSFDVVGLPAPVTKVSDVVGEQDFSNLDPRSSITPSGGFRLFDYSDAIPVAVFIPSLGLIVIVALFALYAGFATARSRGTRNLGAGAAWGASTGPIWAVTMVALNALVQKDFVGKANGDSVFVTFLVGGAVLGALGGLLAAQSQAGEGPAVPPRPPGGPAPPPPPLA